MAFRLFVGSTDQIGIVPVETIEVVEAMPGAVSSMRFTMEPDPGSLTRLTSVRLDTGAVANRLFNGYITNLTYRKYGAGSQRVEVTCVGVEILLDWLVDHVASTTIAFGTNFPDAIAQIITAKTTSLSATINVTDRGGDETDGIGTFIRPDLGTTPFLTGGVNWAPPLGTLRQRIEQLHMKSSFNNAGTRESFGYFLTVDWQLNVRAWENVTSLMPADWTKLEIDNVPPTAGGAFPAEDYRVAYDYGAVPDRVYVVGTGIAGFVGSTSFPRIENVLDAPEITTATERTMAGESYLDTRNTADRWEFDILDFTPPSTTIHAGGLCDVIDSSGTTTDHRIAEIRKTFYSSGRQNWHVILGRPRASMTRSVVARGVGVR